jgi:hypothetical protein
MIIFDFGPPEPTVPLSLELSRDRGLGNVPDDPDRVEGAVVVGRPDVRKITPELAGDDSELRFFLVDKGRTTQFHLVSFACTFAAEAPLRFEQAWIRIVLEAEGGIEPVARSMEPTLLAVPRILSTRVQIGGKCFLIPSVEINNSLTVDDPILRARYEGTSHPEWWMFRKGPVHISEMQRFRLIVEASSDASVHGTVRFGATMKGRKGRVLRYEVPLRETAELGWLLIPATNHQKGKRGVR